MRRERARAYAGAVIVSLILWGLIGYAIVAVLR